MSKHSLQTIRLYPGISLSLLWASLMGLYIYNDYFSLYLPGTIKNMSEGVIGPLGPATDGLLVAVAALLAIPAMMIFLSSALPAEISRWLNIGLGSLYTVVNALTFVGSPLFYQIVVVLEIAATVMIIGCAWRWPRIKEMAVPTRM